MICVSLPVFNQPWLIRRAVDSILAQTFRDIRLVVVNDGGYPPWDRLESVKDERLVRFDLTKNRGPYYANSVVLAATGSELFTVHDSDDWSQSDRLEILFDKLAGLDVAVDGFTRHGTNGKSEVIKPLPNLVGHMGTRALWHIAHHKGLWRTDSLRTLGMGARFRVGWDTYLMHFAARTLKVEWVPKYFGYNQERQSGSLITSPRTGPKSKIRAEAIIIMQQMWNDFKADPTRLAEIVAPPPEVAARLETDAARLKALLV